MDKRGKNMVLALILLIVIGMGLQALFLKSASQKPTPKKSHVEKPTD